MKTGDIWKDLRDAAARDGLGPGTPHPLQQGMDELVLRLSGIGLYHNIVETLIDYGADVHRHGDACMLAAAADGDIRMMQLLHDKGGIPYDTHKGAPLRTAAHHNRTDAVRFLLREEHHVIDDRNAALRIARERGNSEIEQVLRNAGAYDPATESNPLLNRIASLKTPGSGPA